LGSLLFKGFSVGKEDLIAITQDIVHTLRSISEAGGRGFDCSETSIKTLESWQNRQSDVPETLDDIQKNLGDCRRCRLCEKRTHIVFGTGNPRARLVFVGEGPGSDEDLKGEPFVGRAGQLLTRIIHAMHLTREEVYICNIVKCRPPGNRNPMPDEIETCVPFLDRQLMAIKPLYICALGKYAAQTLLNSELPISRLRGRFHEYMGIAVLPTYHPAYLLRNPDKKRDVWEDVQKIMKALP